MRKISFVVIILPFLMLCGCGGDGQKEKYVQIGKESVLEMLESVSDSTKILLEDIEESGLNTSVKYDLIKMTTTILLQQNSAYASLSAGELSQSMREVEEVRLMTVKAQARLGYEKDRMGVNRYTDNVNFSNTKERQPETPTPMCGKSNSPNKVAPSTTSGYVGSHSATGNSGKSQIEGNKWRLKINGKWNNGWVYKIGKGTRVKIEVYNGDNPVKVKWDWGENVTVYSVIRSDNTESDNIEVSLKGGRATLYFYTKDNPKDRNTIYLLSDEF